MHKGESCVDPAILGKGFWINSTTVANFRRFQEKEQMESVCKRKLICSQKKWRIQCLHQHTIIGVALKQANWYFFHRQKFVNDLAIHEFHMKRLSLQSTFLNVLKEKEREREKGKNQLAKQLISTFSMIYRKKKGTPSWILENYLLRQSSTQMSGISKDTCLHTIIYTVYNILSLGLKFLTSKSDSSSPFENFHLAFPSSLRKWAWLWQTISQFTSINLPLLLNSTMYYRC